MSDTVLCIDTASPAFALALAVNGDVVDAMQRDSNQDHSRLLLLAIDQLLESRRSDLRGIVVVRGPGSYAGLRVGIATAEGLALALGVPLAGVGTMEAVASASGAATGVAVHPAGRGEWATQRFERGRPVGDLLVAAVSDLASDLYGDGAGEIGGTDIRPISRAAFALTLGLPRLEDAAGTPDAIYLREPHITRPRHERPRVARG